MVVLNRFYTLVAHSPSRNAPQPYAPRAREGALTPLLAQESHQAKCQSAGLIELNSNIEGCWRVGRCWWDKKTAALWPPELRAKHPGPLAVPLKRERSQRAVD